MSRYVQSALATGYRLGSRTVRRLAGGAVSVIGEAGGFSG